MTFAKPGCSPRLILGVLAFCLLAAFGEARASELRVGASTISITPDRPVALSGQMHTRISQGVRSPVTATALAFESRDESKVLDQAIFVACDLVAIDSAVINRVRGLLKGRLLDFDPQKLVISATHTHTAPLQQEGQYLIPKDGVMQPSEYSEFLAGRVVDAVAKAWESRKP
ncbi:hypothetical protein ACYOEI_17320, partial [Singulisphaera rosea]